jgi:hypothetical protein
MSEIELKPCPFCGGAMRRLGRRSATCAAPAKGCDVCLQVFDIESWNRRDLEGAAKPYTHIGKDGKAVLARDLEDQRDAAHKRIEELKEALKPFAFFEFEDCETTRQVWEVVYAGRFRNWVSFDDIDRARIVILKGDT